MRLGRNSEEVGPEGPDGGPIGLLPAQVGEPILCPAAL